MPNRFMLLARLGVLIAPAARAQLRLGDFDISDGKIENAAGGRLMVSTKQMRATLKFQTQQEVTLKLTYLGPTKEVSHLGNGEVRSQFGIKLRAQDTCNIVYVMWHFAPDQKIAVSVKRNPGERTHEECLDHGYINNIKPRLSAAPPAVRPDQPHRVTGNPSDWSRERPSVPRHATSELLEPWPTYQRAIRGTYYPAGSYFLSIATFQRQQRGQRRVARSQGICLGRRSSRETILVIILIRSRDEVVRRCVHAACLGCSLRRFSFNAGGEPNLDR